MAIFSAEEPGFAQDAAMLALGRLDGAMAFCPPAALRILAGRLLRETLIGALRQEGHAFTEGRFQAWFAGLVTLTDTQRRDAMPPRALCEAILTELTHSSWLPLAQLAARLAPALLAARDLDTTDARTDAHDAIADARDLVRRIDAPTSSLAALDALHDAVRESPRFAPVERSSTPVSVGSRRLSLEGPTRPSPRWAVEMVYGEMLRAGGTLGCALPFVGVLRLDTLGTEDRGDARRIRATALRDLTVATCASLDRAAAMAGHVDRPPAGRRATSRAPMVFELLAGFGAMRSAQLESAVGATRLGISGMLQALDAAGLVERSTIAGAHLFAATAPRLEHPLVQTQESPAFSGEALDEYEASMAEIDRLLQRPAMRPD